MATVDLSLYGRTIVSPSDINECDVEGSCHVNANCTDVSGSFMCLCVQGYTGDGFVSCTGRLPRHYVV